MASGGWGAPASGGSQQVQQQELQQQKEQQPQGSEDVPRYIKSNVTTLLKGDLQLEGQRIREAFRPTSFTSLAGLPWHVKPDAIRRSVTRLTHDNLMAAPSDSFTPAGAGNAGHRTIKPHGLFKEFEYFHSPYSIPEDLRKEARRQSLAKRVSPSAFVASVSSRREKFEPMLIWGDEVSDFPTNNVGDPYIKNEAKRVPGRGKRDGTTGAGAFRPPGVAKLHEKGRGRLRDIVKEIFAKLGADWDDCDFSVLVTRADMIVVKFEERSVDSKRALKAYMNTWARSGDVPRAHGLTPAPPEWGLSGGDGWVYFALRPKRLSASHRPRLDKEDKEDRGGG